MHRKTWADPIPPRGLVDGGLSACGTWNSSQLLASAGFGSLDAPRRFSRPEPAIRFPPRRAKAIPGAPAHNPPCAHMSHRRARGAHITQYLIPRYEPSLDGMRLRRYAVRLTESRLRTSRANISPFPFSFRCKTVRPPGQWSYLPSALGLAERIWPTWRLPERTWPKHTRGALSDGAGLAERTLSPGRPPPDRAPAPPDRAVERFGRAGLGRQIPEPPLDLKSSLLHPL
jgi:hypothetical protein